LGSVALVALVEELEEKTTRNGDPYLLLKLTDLTGSCQAFLWSNAPSFMDRAEIRRGGVFRLGGEAKEGKGKISFHLRDFFLLSSPPGGREAEPLEGREWVERLLRKRVSFDIETVPLAGLEDLPAGLAEKIQGYAERDDGDAGKVMSLSPLFGQVVSLAVLDMDDPDNRVVLALPKQKELFPSRAKGGDPVAFLPNEAEILKAFWALASTCPLMVSFNGRRFDVPFLQVRSAVYGIPVPVDLLGPRYSKKGRPHLDLFDVVTAYGLMRGPASLDACCHAFGIPTPKAALDGSKVAGAYEEGRIREIALYNLADVEATRDLYFKLESTLLLRDS
ncbi:MAG TPA: hypothetical protein ENJ97_07460, partial [Planctomycetes bacterium]|nr:hypothetical protein [Planctomycetota bacterium]